MSRVFRNDHAPGDSSPLVGNFSLILFETDDPDETTTRVFESGLISSMKNWWRLGDILDCIETAKRCNFPPAWYEVTDDPEVQSALVALDKERPVV